MAYQNAVGWNEFSYITADIPFEITLQSNDSVMGTAYVIQANTCINNTATIEAVPNTGYRFVRWSDSNTDNPRNISVPSNLTVMALFEIMPSVTLHINNTIMGIVIGNGSYVKNSVIMIEAIVNTGYRFVQWNDGNTDNPRTITITKDTGFTVIFGIEGMYQLTVLANNPATGSVFGSGDYALNSMTVIEAIPNTGYRFVQWNDGNTDSLRIITVTKDTIFIAEFEVIMYHVTVNMNDSNMGTVSGNGNYAINIAVIIGATANQGYRFIQWNDGDVNNLRTFTLTQDTVFTAIFEAMIHIMASSNDLTRGTVTGGGDYIKDSTAIITAIAKTGYRFVQWSDGNTENPRIIVATEDTAFSAIFGRVGIYQVAVLVNNPAMGSISGNGDYAAGEIVIINATANRGFRFLQWNDGNTDNPRHITITSDTVFTALFDNAILYHVTLSANDYAMGSVFGGGDYEANAVITIHATANKGFRFARWNDGNTDNPRTITVTSNITFTAIFDVATAITNIDVSAINIYPNPATDDIFITLSDTYSALFMLYDIQGKMLINQEIISQDKVLLSTFASGIYVYKIITAKGNCQGKLIIRK
jgi:hypothetical protein